MECTFCSRDIPEDELTDVGNGEVMCTTCIAGSVAQLPEVTELPSITLPLHLVAVWS